MASAEAVESEQVPPFVFKYAPMVWLYSKEAYLPSDIGTQLKHTHPKFSHNYSPSPGAKITSGPSPLTLDNLDALNAFDTSKPSKHADVGNHIYLSADEDYTRGNPAWLDGVRPNAEGKTEGAKSCCIIVNDHGTGYVDVFYMYFYAYNQGQIIFGKELGDHLGDWEHNMIRFKDGKPTAIWYSQHASGEALYYPTAVELYKNTARPVTYSAKGTHANYASAGTHSHAIPRFDIPVGFLEDLTDQGFLWDPTLSAYIYKFTPQVPGKDVREGTFKAYHPSDPTTWLQFKGHWGDDAFPLSDPRQHGENIFKNLKYEGGPTGPLDKMLERKNVWTDGAWGEHIWRIMPWA